MAREELIRNSDGQVKIRNPWAVALLPFTTFGIYHLVWWYRINRELSDFGYANNIDLGTNPWLSMLALFPGVFHHRAPLVSYWNGTKRVQAAAIEGGTTPVNGWIALVLYIVIGPAFWVYLQVSLNERWDATAAT